MTLFQSIRLTVAVAAIASFSHAVAAGEVEPPISDDGLYTQPWFKHESFLELKDDLAEAHANGKRLAVIWEQRGCPYCREMHRVNFAKSRIADYIKANFDVIQLNLWGDREVVDTDGEALSEKQLARKWRVQFTPTTVFLGAKGDEVFRMPGYFKPFHFIGAYRYVVAEGYEKEGFQRWLQAHADKLEAEGKSIDLWAN